MGATPNNRYACAVNRIERRLAAANRQVGKLENSLEDAIAKRKAEHARRLAALTRRHEQQRTTLDVRVEREREKLERSFATCEPRATTRIGKTTAWATASEWLALFRRTKGARISSKNRAALEEMIVKLGEHPAVLEEAPKRTLTAIAKVLRYMRGKRADEIKRTRALVMEIRDRPTRKKKHATAPKKKADERPTGEPIVVPKVVYKALLEDVRELDPEIAEPGRIAWARAVENARRTGARFKVYLPPHELSRLAAIESLEALARQYDGVKGKGMALQATKRLLGELRVLSGSVAPVQAPSPTPTSAPRVQRKRRAGRVPAIRWRVKKWKDGAGDRYHEATGTVPDTGIVFTATLVRRKGTHLRDQTVTLVGTRDGVEIGELPREHGTLPDAKKAARGWLRSWWTAPAPASTPPPKPAPEPEPAPAPAPPARKPRTRRANSTRTRKPSTSAPVQVVASALTSPGDGEFIATAPASQLIAAVEAAIKLTGTKREDRRGLGLLSVEGGRLYVTSRRLGGDSNGRARLDCEVVGSTGSERAHVILNLPELLGALKPLASFELTLRVDAAANMLQLVHERGRMVMPVSLGETFENWFLGDAYRQHASIELPHATLASTLESVFYAASKDEARLNLHGVFFESDDAETVVACTDGHRLALARLTVAVAPGAGMLHYDDARALVWLAKGGKQAPARWCSLAVDGGRGAYRWSGVRKGMPWTLTAEMTLWTFPPYRQVIPDPKGATDRCTVRRGELVRALKIAAGDLGGKLERVFLRVRGDGLTLEAENVVQGTRNQVTVPDWSCSLTSAAERVVAVNWRYLAEALDKGIAREFEEARVALFEGLAPLVLRFVREPEGVGVREVVAVVMPMRTD